MYYVKKNIGNKEYQVDEARKIILPFYLAIPCELIKMNIDNETGKEQYEVVLKKVFDKNNNRFNSSLSIYDENDRCINSEIVDEIYENVDKIKELCYDSNMRMLTVQTLGNRECFNELREQYNDEINNYYEQLESKIKIKR